MKNVKRLLVTILCITALVSCMLLTSCGGIFCSHEWGGWTEETASTCSKAGTDVRSCTKCGRTETRTAELLAHTYGDWTVGEDSSCESGVMERVCTVCGHRDTNANSVTHTGGIICDRCGKKTVSIDKIFNITPLENVDNFAVVINDFIIETGENGDDIGSIEVAEMVLYLNADGELEGYGYGELVLENNAVSVSHTVKAALYIDGGIIYAALENFSDSNETDESDVWFEFNAVEAIMGIELVEAAVGMLTFVESKLPEIEEWYSNVFLPIFANADISIEVDENKMSAIAYTIADALFVPTMLDGGMELSLSADAIKAANAKLASAKINELIDAVLGEGIYASIKEGLPAVLDFTVGDLMVAMDKAGINIDALFSALDAFAVIYTEDETATIEAFAGFPELDISELIKEDSTKKLSLRDAVVALLTLEDDPETADNEAYEALDGIIAQIFENMESKTVYELLGAGEELKTRVDNFADELLESLSLKITIGGDGVMDKITVGYTSDDTELEVVLNKAGMNMSFKEIDGNGYVDISMLVNYVTELKKENIAITLESIKSALEIPVITEENLEYIQLGTPYYENDVFVGIKVTDESFVGGASDGGAYTENYEIVEYIITPDTAHFLKVVTDNGCGGKKNVMMVAYVEVNATHITKYYDASGELISTETSTWTKTETTTVTIDIGTHDWIYNETASTKGKCQEYNAEHYTCDKCNATMIRYDFNDHSFGNLTDTANSVKAECSNEGCNKSIMLSVEVDSALELTHCQTAVTGVDELSYTFTVAESGNYVFTSSSDVWYSYFSIKDSSKDDISSSDSFYDGDIESYVYTLEAGQTYYICFYIYAYNTDDTLYLTVAKE